MAERIERAHWALAILYAIFSGLILLAIVACAGCETSFQAGLCAIFVGLGFLLVALGLVPAQRRLLTYQQAAPVVIAASVLSLLLVGLYLYNTAYLLSRCDHPPTPLTLLPPLTPQERNWFFKSEYICAHEYGQAIAWIVLLSLLLLINLLGVLFYAWLASLTLVT
jgi:hypothetical protein